MKSVIFLNSITRNRFYLFITAFCITLVLWSGLKAQSGIVYVYDEVGRLLAVTDPSGDTVRYNYDAVGNVTSITRQSSSTLSLISFSPGAGSVGTSVTIYGTAFSTTPSQNTVTFNGTSATVTASTATKITTTVPTGATTGVIQVTTSAGSVSSSASFTVSASNAPTISSFSPTIGPSGTSVTVSGTNFDTTAAKNKTKFNITNSTVSSATSTSISTNVPSVSSSGKVSVSTTNGTAVSTDDFFVPPSPYTASDVSVTGRMTPGNSQTVTLSTSGKVGMIVFDATAGQRASIKVTSCSFTSVVMSIYSPTGMVAANATSSPGAFGFISTPQFNSTGTYTVLSFSGSANQRVSLKATSGSYSGGSINGTHAYLKRPSGQTIDSTLIVTQGFIDVQTLSTTATHTILVDPLTASTGSVTLQLYTVPADITGSISPGGSAVTVNLNTPGQNGLHTFSGTTNQRVFLKVTGGSFSGGNPSSAQVYLKKPDGTTLENILVATTGYIDTKVLPTTGTYTVFTDGSNSSTGSLTLTLYDVAADVTGTITAGGSAVSVTTTSPGQNGLHTFSGTVNGRISLRVTGGSFSGGFINGSHVRIKKPDGTNLASILVTSTGFIDATNLPTSGTYTATTDPLDASTGTLTLNLYDVVDSSGSITIGGSAVSINTSVPGQNGTLTFTGTSSQQVNISITNNTTSCVGLVLKQPNGSTMTSTSFCGATFNLSTQTLPATGTYTIEFNPSGTNTGSFNVTATTP